jgi:deoxyribonuclease IV
MQAARAGLRPAVDELGAHMSVAGGFHRALERGQALRCGAIQLFVKNQLQWAAAPLHREAVDLFREARRRTRIGTVFAHASYLLNLGSPAPAAWHRSVAALTDELERAEALGLSFVVVHPGSHLGAGCSAGMRRVTAALDEVLRRTAGYRVKVALENTAGGRHTLGRTMEELAAMVGRTRDSERLGVCLDTCHLFAAGVDLREAAIHERLMEEVEATVGFRTLLAFHLNDARTPLGSGLDRHEHIGRGYLGLGPFRAILNDPRLAHVPKVLETPKEPEPLADRRNLVTLRRLRSPIAVRPAPQGTRATPMGRHNVATRRRNQTGQRGLF